MAVLLFDIDDYCKHACYNLCDKPHCSRSRIWVRTRQFIAHLQQVLAIAENGLQPPGTARSNVFMAIDVMMMLQVSAPI